VTLEQVDIARRLVACEEWRWLPGSLQEHQDAVAIRGPGSGLQWQWVPGSRDVSSAPAGEWVLDLTDDATAGVLLGVLLAAFSEEWPLVTMVSPIADDDGWSVEYGGRQHPEHIDLLGVSPHLGEAVAAALLNLWGAE